MENHQLTNEIERERGKKGRYKITRRQKINGSNKSLHTNNHPKWIEWIEFTKRKAQSG